MTTFPEGGEGLCEVARERVCLLSEAAERNVLECSGRDWLAQIPDVLDTTLSLRKTQEYTPDDAL